MDSFTKWLQGQLNSHGFNIEVDGVFGPGTRSALKDFQVRHHLKPTGQAGKKTIAKLKRKGNLAVPTPRMPPWLAELTRVMGLHERRHNSKLSKWLRSDGKTLGDPAKLPWCGDAIQTCILKTLDEPVPNNPYWARNWDLFGIKSSPVVGAIGVIAWKRGGHVGIVIDVDLKGNRVRLRGGNQKNQVCDVWFSMRHFIGFRWPKSYPKTNYPPIKSSSNATAGYSGTR